MIIDNAFATTRWLPHRTTHFALSELLLTLRLEASACSTGRLHFDDGDPYVISSKWKGIVASVVDNVMVKEWSKSPWAKSWNCPPSTTPQTIHLKWMPSWFKIFLYRNLCVWRSLMQWRRSHCRSTRSTSTSTGLYFLPQILSYSHLQVSQPVLI